jgi:predicted nucleic acid-binding protein
VKEYYVLDACALIALIKGEEGEDIVWNILYHASIGSAEIIMHEINLLEVYYGFYHERGKDYAKEKVAEAGLFFITIRGLTDSVFIEAGRLKASYKISLADSIALAQASVSGGILLTADHHEFDAVEQGENIKFCWIR